MEHLRKICNPMDINVIIYHNPCMDGYASAYIAKHFIGKELKFIPKSLDRKPIDIEDIKDKNVLMIDIVCENVEEINSHANSLIILDHHKTNQDKLKDINYAYFDMHKSGVGLAWEYFYINEDKYKMPLFLKCIQDRDLWTWIIPESRFFCDYLYEEVNFSDQKFKILKELMNEWDDKKEDNPIFNNYYNIGKILNKMKMKNIENIVKYKSKLIELNIKENMYKVYIYNTPTDASDLGNYVMENLDCDFVIIWCYNHASELYTYSVRSIDKKTDVGYISKIYGGGGHRNAAGFSSDKHPKDLFIY
jgi:oligoribonuclease NrnB/cAMP/cGMP phosphodiesterase (DHH superfamily)